MTDAKKLKSKSLKHLKSYFNDKGDQKILSEKFRNISGKTGQYFVPDTLFQKRTSRKNRALIPFKHIVESRIDYEWLNSFEGGVVVEFTNNEYFDQLNMPEEDQHSIFKKLKDKLGSDDNVSAIICIRSTGESSSQSQREALKKLNTFLQSKNKTIEDVLIQRKDSVQYSGIGNDKWSGFVYYSVKGGNKDAIDSHKEHNIASTSVQLFNPSVEYANSVVSTDITLVLIYFAFYSVQPEKRSEEWKVIISEFEEYFATKIYNAINLLDYVKKHICLNLNKDKNIMLMDPIQVAPIFIEDFVISGREENSLDITHQTSVNRRNYIWDEYNHTILTPARPTNLFWSKHLSNMMQQDFSLKEYFYHQLEIMKKWEKFGFENLSEI